jgi:hypothetical protein
MAAVVGCRTCKACFASSPRLTVKRKCKKGMRRVNVVGVLRQDACRVAVTLASLHVPSLLQYSTTTYPPARCSHVPRSPCFQSLRVWVFGRLSGLREVEASAMRLSRPPQLSVRTRMSAVAATCVYIAGCTARDDLRDLSLDTCRSVMSPPPRPGGGAWSGPAVL